MEVRLLCNQECKIHKAKRLGRKGGSWLHTGNLDTKHLERNSERSVSVSIAVSGPMLLQGREPTVPVLSMLRQGYKFFLPTLLPHPITSVFLFIQLPIFSKKGDDTPLLPSYLIWLGLHQGSQWGQLVLRTYTSGLPVDELINEAHLQKWQNCCCCCQFAWQKTHLSSIIIQKGLQSVPLREKDAFIS